jgi:hypothetical protein
VARGILAGCLVGARLRGEAEPLYDRAIDELQQLDAAGKLPRPSQRDLAVFVKERAALGGKAIR